MFKKFFYFNDYYKNFGTVYRFKSSLKNVDVDFVKINNFILYNINLRNQYPILNFKVREKSILDFCKVVVIGFMLDLNFYYDYEHSIKFFFSNSYNKFKNSSCVLFYSENNFFDLNLGLVLSNIFSLRCKNLSCFNNFNILKYEFNKSSKSSQNFFITYFSNSFFFNDFKVNNNEILNKNNILLANTKVKSFNYDFIIPLKQVFERSCVFLNIFGIFNDFTFSSYRYFFKELKNDWFLFKTFFKKCGIKFKFKLSNFKSYIFSRK